ncbi:MAG: tetratricopeptide repeat protein [Candidatus Thiodiazotropha lotti]|nr:tetratricopeptide repeat protein [Candidatus Thiodiazotropha lotti]
MKLPSIFIFLFFLSGLTFSSEKFPTYTGSLTCQGCHQIQYEAWSDSHHSWAWRKPALNNVLGDFDSTEFKHAGFTYRFITENSNYYVIADNKSGKAQKFKVHSVAGITPLQQYLVETDPGHLQALDVVWDTERKRWYHLYPDQDTSAGTGMHWTGPYKNWNSRCAECHATDYRKYYDPLKASYNSQQAEVGVGCEACHGPGEAHLSWANAPEKFAAGLWKGTDAKGLTAAYVENNAASEINLCAGCHSRREPIGANSPEPGSEFDDHYRIALLRDGLYFPDGQIHDEVYVYGSFVQSKMYQKGVKCSNCHDAHSYQLKAEGNALCTLCHNPRGNALFPSLRKNEYDSVEHHFHEADSEGAECKQCHMPERHYMIVDGRRDHSFRIPRPDLSEKMAVPNVCNTCHKDKSPDWSVAEIAKRYPDGQFKKRHFAEVINLADTSLDNQVVKQLLGLANNKTIPAIVRASALENLRPAAGNLDFDKIYPLLSDENAWVRTAAANLFVFSADEKKTDRLLPLLSDPIRSVRLEAIKAFLSHDLERLALSDSAAVKKAMKEYQQSLSAKADFPETQMVIGGVALTTRNISAAISAFSQAVEMDPQLIQAWVMLARIQAAVGQNNDAKLTLRKALKENQNNEELQNIFNNL